MQRTIAAVSTPRGKGGVALIRISGDDAIKVAEKCFRTKSGKPLDEIKANTAVYGTFFDRDGDFDDGITTFFRAPHSYTGEDTAEFCCHGGVLVTARLLTAAIAAGADYAAAGEYTKRAFINGKMSLSEAEAIGNLIDSKSNGSMKISLLQSQGSLSRKIAAITDKLTYLAASVYAYIDYPDEDMTDISPEEMKLRLTGIKDEIITLENSFRYGKAISEGIPAVIVGKPNAGKSTLYNLLIGYDRAIVTDVAGTTRDVITETVRVGDVLLILADTAGIRESSDRVEAVGIEKSLEYLSDSSLVIAVFDAASFGDDDKKIIDEIKKYGKQDATVAIYNKTDSAAGFALPGIFGREILFSAVNGTGLPELTSAISSLCGGDGIDGDSLGTVIMNARQHAVLIRAENAVNDALTALDGFTQDVAGFGIEDAIAALNELDGRNVSEQIVNSIFSHFCVGK